MLRKTGLFIGVFLVLSACAAEMDDWQGTTTKSHRIEWAVASHELAFEADSRWLAGGELRRLDAFLSHVDLRRPTHVYVATSGQDGELDRQRNATLHALLRARGVVMRETPPEPGPAGVLPSAPQSSDNATLMVGYYDVSVPNCPDLSKPTVADFSNQPSSNFGCATAINLGMMVADPRDLHGSPSEGLADGRRATLPIIDYRKGGGPVIPRQSSGTGEKE